MIFLLHGLVDLVTCICCCDVGDYLGLVHLQVSKVSRDGMHLHSTTRGVNVHKTLMAICPSETQTHKIYLLHPAMEWVAF